MTDTPQKDAPTSAGFVAIIGAPNAGKSTLVNRLVGTKISIVTHKVQTTRFPVRGVVMHDNAQIILVDTPGIFRPKRRLDRAMVRSAWGGAEDADAVVHLIDAAAWIDHARGDASPAQIKSVEDDQRIIDGLREAGRTARAALNKIDLFDHSETLPLISQFKEQEVYSDFFILSALNGDGVDALIGDLADAMPEGPFLYPEDQAADLPMQLLAAEVTREKAMLRLHEELPYQLTVVTEEWERKKDGSVRIQQAIIVGRENHKGMVLGKGGQTIRSIGQASRTELRELMETEIHLFLFVKVDERWAERRDNYASLGLDFDA